MRVAIANFAALSTVVVVAGHFTKQQQQHAAHDEKETLTPTVFLQAGETPQEVQPDAGSGAITVGSHRDRKWWGFPNYLKDMDESMRTWPELQREQGKLGNTCDYLNKDKQCGNQFVCKEGVCGMCQISRDCGEHFLCEAADSGNRRCIPRDLLAQWKWSEVLLTVLIIVTAVLSAAAGMGGGGVFVPLLLLLGVLSTKEAVPLSQSMIVGGAVVNMMMFCGERHPKYHSRPKIDYEVIMMLNPGLAGGVSVGVICHVMSPQWIIVVTLNITLIIALQKSLTKGMAAWKKESKMLEEKAAADAAAGPGSGGGAPAPPPIKMKFMGDFRAAAQLAQDNRTQVALIFGSWATFLILNMFKAPQCSALYWMQLVGMVVICATFTLAGASTIRAKGAVVEEGLLEWTPRTLWLYPVMSVVAGFLGGFLGIGGGIIMGPMLIELGMVPEANQATTAAFVFLSSSLATIQFIVLGKTMPQYVAWFTTWVILATFVGQTALDYLLKKYQRASLIVLSIAGITAASLIMMSLIGASDILHDLYRGAYMGFSAHSLCNP